MNRLDTTPLGGVPFDWDDWKWEQDGVREAFYGLISSWGIDPSDSFILSGCTSTLNGLNYDISEGYIALDGEIYKVDAHSVVVSLPVGFAHFWSPLVSYDPAGLEATKNAGTVNTYEIRRASVVNATSPVSFMPMLADTIHSKMAENILPFFGDWTTIDLNGSTDVVQHDAIGGTGNDIALSIAPQAGSYIRYNIVGKVVHGQILINNFKTTTFATSAAFSIILRNLPFSFKVGITQHCPYMSEGDQAGSYNANHSAILSTNRVIFEQADTSGIGTVTFWNRFYDLIAPPNKNLIETALTSLQAEHTIRGSFTAELN